MQDVYLRIDAGDGIHDVRLYVDGADAAPGGGLGGGVFYSIVIG